MSVKRYSLAVDENAMVASADGDYVTYEDYAVLRQEEEDLDRLRERMSSILRATANALKGEPSPLELHGWSDLPEVAAKLQAKCEILAEAVRAWQWTHAALRADVEAQLRGDAHPDHLAVAQAFERYQDTEFKAMDRAVKALEGE